MGATLLATSASNCLRLAPPQPVPRPEGFPAPLRSVEKTLQFDAGFGLLSLDDKHITLPRDKSLNLKDIPAASLGDSMLHHYRGTRSPLGDTGVKRVNIFLLLITIRRINLKCRAKCFGRIPMTLNPFSERV